MKLLRILYSVALFQGICLGSIAQGIEWLEGVQDTQGFWVDSCTNSYQATYTVLEAFYTNSKVDSSFHRGLEWLENYSTASVDHRARYLTVSSRIHEDTTGLLDSLLLFKNPDSGFGLDMDFQSDHWDTYLSLLSLNSSGYQNTEVLQSIIGYLVSQQDSCWRIMNKSTLVTAKVLYALDKYQNSFNLTLSMDKGFAWLLNRQNPNGSFGEGSVYETAFVLLEQMPDSSKVLHFAPLSPVIS